MRHILLFLILLPYTSSASAHIHYNVPLLEYHQPETVDDGLWEELIPYFLPDDHEIKKMLDHIFSKDRVIVNRETVKEAGFKCKAMHSWSYTTVASHPKMKGYFFKMFTEDLPDRVDHTYWLDRIHGAEVVRQSIEKYGYQHIFKVPKKWIYPLPPNPMRNNCPHRNFILVCEDMKTISSSGNDKRWKSSHVTPEILDALYTVLTDAGMNDSIYPFNIPFCKDGRIAFLDTEHFHNWPIAYDKMTPYLSTKNQAYWQSLITNIGNRS